MWKQNDIQLINFKRYLNNNQDNLTFTMDQNKTTINYLDVRLYILNDRVHTSLFCKPTSGNAMLLPQLCHKGAYNWGIYKSKKNLLHRSRLY